MTADLAAAAALGIAVAGLLVAVGVALAARSHVPALPVLLDMLTAAGLLQLTADQSWPALGLAAGLVLARLLLLRRDGSSRRPSRPAGPPRRPGARRTGGRAGPASPA